VDYTRLIDQTGAQQDVSTIIDAHYLPLVAFIICKRKDFLQRARGLRILSIMSKRPPLSPLCPMRVVTAEVLYVDQALPALTQADFERLKTEGQRNERKTIRACAHKAVEDSLHEMFIVHDEHTYVPPHKHRDKQESSHVIEGRMDIVLFDDVGVVTQVIRMGDYASGLPFYFRVSEPVYHTMLMRTPTVSYHETTTGPFRREDFIIAPFAPSSPTRDEQIRFMAELKERIDRES
jgi:cupin fold WbuC family metalloprotein